MKKCDIIEETNTLSIQFDIVYKNRLEERSNMEIKELKEEREKLEQELEGIIHDKIKFFSKKTDVDVDDVSVSLSPVRMIGGRRTDYNIIHVRVGIHI